MATSIKVNPRLRATIRDEPKQMLQPISGYEDEPLLPLDQACKPLKNIIDEELQQNIIIAKMNSKKPQDGLSQDESAAIHLYTMEWKVSENSLYAVLNRTLRSVDRRKLQPWFRYLKLFLTAFYKLPPTEHRIVWRGVPEDLSSLYPKGNEITWWAVSSCTTSISVLESPYYVGTSGPRTIFSIETHSGKSIRSHSYFQQEDEILLPPGIYLQVVDKLSPAEGLNIIQLREISPPYKMLADPFDLSQVKQVLPQPKPPSVQKNFPVTTITSGSSKAQEKVSTTSVASKPPAKQKNFPPTKSATSKIPIKQKSFSTPNPALKPLVKQKGFPSTTNRTSKIPIAQKYFSTTIVAPKPPSTEDICSTTTVVQEPFVEVSWEKEEPLVTAANNSSPYPDKKLNCKGRACTKCGYCRDWYWSLSYIILTNYTKRANATCIGDSYSYSGHLVEKNLGHDHEKNRAGGLRLCECADNRP